MKWTRTREIPDNALHSLYQRTSADPSLYVNPDYTPEPDAGHAALVRQWLERVQRNDATLRPFHGDPQKHYAKGEDE